MAVTSKLRHVIESQQFSRALLEDLFARAEEIKREIRAFLRDALKLELSEEKTLIPHARTSGSRRK